MRRQVKHADPYTVRCALVRVKPTPVHASGGNLDVRISTSAVCSSRQARPRMNKTNKKTKKACSVNTNHLYIKRLVSTSSCSIARACSSLRRRLVQPSPRNSKGFPGDFRLIATCCNQTNIKRHIYVYMYLLYIYIYVRKKTYAYIYLTPARGQ